MKVRKGFRRVFFFWSIALFFCFFSPLLALSKTHYRLSTEPIDVVIPCCPKDLLTLEECIRSIRKYGKDIRRVIVVSKSRLTDSAEWFDENLYPFSMEDIALELFRKDRLQATQYLESPKTRIGWMYQQFLKLYAPFVIPGISSNVLVLDADVIFLSPIAFMTEKAEPFFTVAEEYHDPYFRHMARLLPGLKRVYKEYSGISHHMLLQKPILEDLQRLVYEQHKEELWVAFCHCVAMATIYHSTFSEYEIYFNFALLRTEQAHLRKILWKNVESARKRDLKKYRSKGYKYIACHSYNR